MMKLKILIIFLAILIFFNFTVLAEEESTDIVEESGIQPNNPLYFLDTAIDNLRLALTQNEEKKARLELRIANERLKEINLMIQRNRIKNALKTQELYQKRLEQVKARIQKLKETTAPEVITELETEIESQELLVEDINTASLLPKFTEENKVQVKNLIQEMKQISQETRQELQKRKQELIALKPELDAKFEEVKATKLKPEIENRIAMLAKKVEISEKILAEKTETTAEDTSNLELAKTKLEEAQQALEAENYEEAKALTLEVNKLAVLVRSVAAEAKEKIRNAREIALTRETIPLKTEVLNQEKERFRNAVDILEEKEAVIEKRQQQIIAKKQQIEETTQQRTIVNAEANKDIETASQQERRS